MKKVILTAVLVMGTIQAFASGDGPGNSNEDHSACSKQAVQAFFQKEDGVLKELVDAQITLRDQILTDSQTAEISTRILQLYRERAFYSNRTQNLMRTCDVIK